MAQTDAALSLNREKVIVKTSVIGIAANALLVAFKAAIGLASGSIAVILDAVNNLSDALSSVITILGAKLGAKQPNKKHPLGYGRIEYLSSMMVSAIVLYAGITSLVESVKKIIHPEAADYTVVSLVIIAAAVVVKLILGAYVKKQGKKVDSGALVASGSDASFDAVLSAPPPQRACAAARPHGLASSLRLRLCCSKMPENIGFQPYFTFRKMAVGLAICEQLGFVDNDGQWRFADSCRAAMLLRGGAGLW